MDMKQSMSNIDLITREVARIALQNAAMTEYIGKELDMHEEELQQLAAYLERTQNY